MKTPICLRCGSAKLMPDMPLQDCYGDMGNRSGPAEVHVAGKPEAWFFKETSKGQVLLTICGDCGYAELQVNNFRELYERYLQASEPRP